MAKVKRYRNILMTYQKTEKGWLLNFLKTILKSFDSKNKFNKILNNIFEEIMTKSKKNCLKKTNGSSFIHMQDTFYCCGELEGKCLRLLRQGRFKFLKKLNKILILRHLIY